MQAQTERPTAARPHSPRDSEAPGLSDRQEKQSDRMLASILASVTSELPESIGAALSVYDRDEPANGTTALAAWGCGELLTELQNTGGPVVDAVDEPIVTHDVWDDPRWPHLTLATVWARHPNLYQKLRTVRGLAAIPISRESQGHVVLSVALHASVDPETLMTLERHRSLVSSAVAAFSESLDNSQRADAALEMLQSRAAIEQAKGIVMAARHCDADQAWALLREISTQLNVKVRNLAVALIEHLGVSPAEQPADQSRQIVPSQEDHAAASVLWDALDTVTGGVLSTVTPISNAPSWSEVGSPPTG